MVELPVMAFLGGQLGGSEMLLIMAAALLMFGAKNLPKIARNLGRSMEEFRRAARDVTTEIMHADEDAPKVTPPPPPPSIAEPKASPTSAPRESHDESSG